MDATSTITITKLPRGDAPEVVRRAWIGLTLPAYPIYGFAKSQTVISGTPVALREVFEVPQDGALKVLKKHDPEAARFWKAMGFPRPGGIFHFGTDEGTAGPGMQRAKLSVWCDLERNWIL